MDLGAYSKIETLGDIAKKNGISCPRLRGYRLMKDEEPVDVAQLRYDIELNVMEDLCETYWGRARGWSVIDSSTRAKYRYYIRNYDYRFKDEDAPDYKKPEIRWDRLRGKKKRIFITHVKNELKRFKQQYAIWNRYVGRDDILYIHARIGGGNWPEYYTDVVDKPWFIEKVDDAYDSTYCDIYAKIEPCIEEVPEADESEI